MTFAPGDTVIVKNDWPERTGPVHIRTPHYVRGHRGQVLRHFGAFPNPEDLAFNRPAPQRDLYHVAFSMGQLWPEARMDDQLVVELFEHWLERP